MTPDGSSAVHLTQEGAAAVCGLANIMAGKGGSVGPWVTPVACTRLYCNQLPAVWFIWQAQDVTVVLIGPLAPWRMHK